MMKTRVMPWRVSSACSESACVEVASASDGVYFRDGKDKLGPVLRFTRAEWDAFLTGVKRGEFDVL